MTVMRASSVSIRPNVELIQWRVMEVSITGARHLVGCETLGFCGRVSSTIASFDIRTADVRTRSGRKYVLKGQPGFHPAAEYAWTRWCGLNHVEKFVEVTHEYLDSHLENFGLPSGHQHY